MKTFKLLSTALFYGVLSVIFVQSLHAQDKKWDIPEKYYSMKNPVELNEKVLNKGKAHYIKLCVLCHGKAGVVEGNMATMNPQPTNLTQAAFQDQKDGVIYYKIRTGKPPKPSFDHILSEEETWELVHYLRTLKKD